MRKFSIFVSLVVLALSNSAFAQTTQEAKDQAAIEKVKAEAAASKAAAKKSEIELQQAEEKAKLDLQAARDKADEAQRKALTDSIGLVNNLKTNATDVSVEGNAIETKALANRAVSEAVQHVVENIKPTVCATNTTVILADDQAIGTLPSYEAGVLTLSTLATNYDALVTNAQNSFAELKDVHDGKIKKTERAAMAGVTALLEGVAAVGSIAQTFRTSIKVVGTDVTIDQLAIYGALAASWNTNCKLSTLTAYPNLGVDFATSEAAKQLKNISDSLSKAQDLESQIAIWLVQNKPKSTEEMAALDAAKKDAVDKKSPKGKVPTAEQKAAAETRKLAITKIESLLEKLKADNQRADQAIQQMVSTSEKQPVSPIVQLAKAERFATAVKSDKAYILTIKAVAGGGNTVTTNNFWRGPKVFHSGGAVLAYTLLKGTNGAYVGGGLLDGHQGYVQLSVESKNLLGNSWDVKSSPARKSSE